ncbi:MAG: diguanylate cyclase [Rhodoferax sp.]
MRSSISLYLAVLVLVVSTGIGSYVDLENNEMHARHLAINTGLERMLRLNQELNSMVMVSVLEQNTLRTASYDTVSAELADTIKTVEKLTQQQNLSDEMSDLRTEHAKLHVIEEQVLRLMRQDRWQEARKLLFDEAYVLSKKIYEINSETVVGALTGELAATAAHLDRLRNVSLGVRIGALLLLLWVGAMFSRRLRAEATEQARLREAVSAANLALEEKVQQRTNELEAANRKLLDLSSTDGLTGLANRRRFDAVWETEWQRALRQGLSLAVAMIDVDQFKTYNDHYGHQAGDECLKQVAQVLGTMAQRSGELAARYGGEEFVVILPSLDRDEALTEAERIRAAVQALQIAHAFGTGAGVLTISIGVATCIPSQGESSAGLLRAADAALYEAKHLGRNRVQLAH